MKDDCIFCKIANGQIPSKTLYEDEDFRVILDLGPATEGHALILPKEHAANLFELSEDVASKALLVAQKVAIRMKETLGCDGLNLVQNNGEAAGQTVLHFHIHVNAVILGIIQAGMFHFNSAASQVPLQKTRFSCHDLLKRGGGRLSHLPHLFQNVAVQLCFCFFHLLLPPHHS